MADLSTEKKLNDLIREREQIEGRIGDLKKGPYKSTLNKLIDLEGKILKLQKQQSDEQAKKNKAAQAEQKIKNRSIALDQKLLKLSKSSTGQILESFNLMGGLEKSTMQAGKASGKLKEGYNLVSAAQLNAIEELKAGTFDAESYVENVKDELLAMGDEGAAVFNRMEKDLESFAQTVRDTPDIGEKLKVEAEAQAKMGAFKDKVKETSALLSSPKAMGVAALGLAAKIATDFASSMLDVRQSLGTSAVDSARIAGNMAAAGAAAKVVGGNSQEAEAAIKGLVREFGSLSVVSLGVSTQLGLITGQFGISGDNAAKLLKSMDAISTASIETNLNLISSVGELARAEGVAPAQVLNDMASDTELFAKFGKDGGKNIGLAAIQAAKLGVNMATVAGIAESLLDFESSITNEMEAEVLLGKNLNLNKARELSLAGDLEGLQKEILKNVGSEAEFNAMNVVQRQALAKALGMNVADLGKMVAGEKTSAQVQQEQAETQRKQMDMQQIMMGAMVGIQGIQASIVALEAVRGGLLGQNLVKTLAGARASLAGAVGSIFRGTSILGPLGIPVALAAIAGMFALGKKAMGFEEGGMVGRDGGRIAASDTIPAMLTPGEVVLNAAQQTNVAGSIGGEPKQLIALQKKTNELLNTLIRKTGEQALAS